ncbi:efflux RND transporter periplasmic adaptor subunit [Edaphosphingomonas haloaromaticamans]|uniref:Putative efflux pump periplasmic linker TtgA n=1 Tax=Edaphosphingomonas haloaromaticamans TaxID=653954 RepID=A0A1S1HE48_9SPHN|nr:efflux RND transporter periplasmic adaptor subunit [Sphingomonas haloaromaticamans]OHT19776.1 putative efflux pump periplasmic linker TtgA precursor [Sphingomonas haloaromaticamans]
MTFDSRNENFTDRAEVVPVPADAAPAAVPPFTPRRSRVRLAALVGLPVAALLGVGHMMMGGTPASADAPSAPTVTVATPVERSVTEWDDYIGRFAASQAVEIRPRVSGQITGIHFKDGDFVRKGQLLFTIDPRPFTAAMAEAQARAASARTAAALARSELARAERLIADEAVSAEEIDSLRAAVRSANAAVAAAEATVRTRALDVEFTQVRAPISGRVSDRRADIGNLVAGDNAGSATLLTTVYALDPIYFTFDGSEALYLKAQRLAQAGEKETTVQVRLQDETDYRWNGRIDFTDNGIDPNSGTIRGRAVIPNPDHFLTPGMFGNMRLSGGQARPALLVPDSAVVSDQARKVVLVVQQDGTVVARPVELGAVVDGLRIIRSGIAARDRVVISGMQLAQPGTMVQTRAGKVEAVKAASNGRPITPPASQATFTVR